MKVFAICPECKFETEINNIDLYYCMCQNCREVFNISGNAKVQGLKISESRKEELYREIEKEARRKINNWTYKS